MANAKKTLTLTCQEATFLITQNEGMRVSLLNRLKLNYHFLSCPPCKRFAAQSQKIEDWMKQYATQHETSTNRLSESFKERLQQEIDKQI